MRCPKCGQEKTKVKDSRASLTETKRRRRCPQCGHRWSTVEVYEHWIKRKPLAAGSQS